MNNLLEMSNLLLMTILLPLVGAAVVCVVGRRSAAAARQSALVTTLLTLAGAGVLMLNYPATGGVFAENSLEWLAPLR